MWGKPLRIAHGQPFKSLSERVSRRKTWFRPPVVFLDSPIAGALLALGVYTGLAVHYGPLWSATKVAYFNYLADALLHGQLSLRLIPPSTHDLILFNERYYLYWGPFPAVLLMPFVALFGIKFSDILFTLGLAACNVWLVALVLRQACRRGVIRLSQWQRGLLVLFFAMGTVHMPLAPLGRVWRTGQLTGFLCIALAYLAALSLRGRVAFALTGLALACGLLTRNHLLFAGVWPACYLLQQHRAEGRHRQVIAVLVGLAPIVLAIGLLATYNWLRFGSVFDNGLDYHRMHSNFASDYKRYGAFHIRYLPTNLFYQYLAYPFPLRPTTFYGGSLFLLSPVFFAVFWGITLGYPRWSVWALLGSILLVAAPILLLMGTGWVQFGPRYTLDFTMPLLLLTALGVRYWHILTLALLTVISIAHYLVGTMYLLRYY